MLAANADFQSSIGSPAVLNGNPHEASDAGRIERLERVAIKYVRVVVVLQELALGILAAKAVRGLRKVVGAKAEERRARAHKIAQP